MNEANSADERIVILAPFGRDSDVIGQVLEKHGFSCASVSSVDCLVSEIGRSAGAAVIAEESLRDANVPRLVDYLENQELWSDFPFIVLVSKKPPGANHGAGAARPEKLGNVILLERPLNAETLRSAANSALRGRRRQYQARDIMADRMRAAEHLRRSQDQLVFLNETLESRIEERTRALAQANDRIMSESIERERVQQALVQFQKMEAIGQLTGGIAHDFNNLLNVIQGNMDLITMLSQEAETKRRAEVARRACERGAKLTSQLLAFSRNQRLNLRATNIRAMCDGVRELLSTSLGSKIQLDVEIADGAGFVMADANQLEMALLNLAINARDAMPGGGRLLVSARPAAPPPGLLPEGSYCLISVSDTGSGIRPENLTKVFEPFFTTKGVGKGTGLGLSQVYGMAQQSGGIATVFSQEAIGTTVEIWLRQAVADDSCASLGLRAQPKASHAGARILVVEDDSSVRQSMVDSLEVLGYEVAQAADGESGLHELRRQRPSLMITDFLMPGMTGAELVEKASQEYPGLPMIIATGYADMQAVDKVLSENTVLRKPFQLTELAAKVAAALEIAEPSRQLHAARLTSQHKQPAAF